MPHPPFFLIGAALLLAAAIAACAPGAPRRAHPRPLFMGPPGVSSPLMSDMPGLRR